MRISPNGLALILFAGIFATRCASQPCTKELSDVLRLEIVSLAPAVDAGSSVATMFSVRNVGARPIDVCFQQSGVSVMLEHGDGARWPLIQYGPTLHSRCPSRVRLKPNDTRDFAETLWIPSTSAGSAILEASMYVSRPPAQWCSVADSEAVLLATRPIVIAH